MRSVEVVSEFRFFSRAASESVAAELAPLGLAVTLTPLREAQVPSRADLVILQSHIRKTEPQYLEALRQSGYAGTVAVWSWDNHHAREANQRVAALADVAIPAHACHGAYLGRQTRLLPSVMLCTAQWTPLDARRLGATLPQTGARRPDLYGGFAGYKGTPRTAWLEAQIATGRYPALYFVDTPRAGSFTQPDYFKQDAAERFAEWASHAVSLCLPYRHDLSNRFFDAWLTGQIPVVTPDIPELDAAWAQPHRDRHFVCATGYEPAAIDAAHARALELFTEGGVEGLMARHTLALGGHMLHHRIARIAGLIESA